MSDLQADLDTALRQPGPCVTLTKAQVGWLLERARHERGHTHTMKIGAYIGDENWQLYCTECDEPGLMAVPA